METSIILLSVILHFAMFLQPRFYRGFEAICEMEFLNFEPILDGLLDKYFIHERRHYFLKIFDPLSTIGRFMIEIETQIR